MYLYSLYGYEENRVFQHEKKFTDREFKNICKEVPILQQYGLKYYDVEGIENHLIKKYGFKPIKYQARFFFNADIN